jgi:hypothetical protein
MKIPVLLLAYLGSDLKLDPPDPNPDPKLGRKWDPNPDPTTNRFRSTTLIKNKRDVLV